jgi:hypothetical protein
MFILSLAIADDVSEPMYVSDESRPHAVAVVQRASFPSGL